jgi:hypothetical protein
MTLYPEYFVKDRLYIKFSNAKKAEWNVTIKRKAPLKTIEKTTKQCNKTPYKKDLIYIKIIHLSTKK